MKEGQYNLVTSYLDHNALKGQGNSSSRVTYSYIDKEIEPKKEYCYKLIDVDFNGHKTQHGPVLAALKPQSGNYYLYQNHPNPFNSETKISFNLSQGNYVKLTIINNLGQKINTLVNRFLPSGYQEIVWDGKNEVNHPVSISNYYYFIEVGDFKRMKKLTLIK